MSTTHKRNDRPGDATPRPKCHPDCGPIVGHDSTEHTHAHRDEDGICWHPDNDGYPA